MTIEITATAIDDWTGYLESAPRRAQKAARLAINTVVKRAGLKLLRDQMLSEVAWPKGYLNEDRLKVSKLATEADLEAVIFARQRPTSLARFVQGSAVPTGNRRGGVSVMVQPGRVKHMPAAFLMRLRSGTELSDDRYNVGLAIRLKPGERVYNKREATQVGHNLYLLYGPSPDQVFRSVAGEKADEIGDMVAGEFFRQFARLESDDA